jgi:hypothetical protein
MINSLIINDNEVVINGEIAVQLTEAKDSPTNEAGGMREVYLTSQYVFKRGSINEGRLFIEPEDRKHFAAIVLVDIQQRWVIQARVDCSPRMCTKSEYKIIKQMCQKYNIYDVSWTSEVWGTKVLRNTHNWITDNNGVPVIFDYEDGRW